MYLLKLAFHFFIILLLTIVTQIGGIIYILALIAIRKNVKHAQLKKVGLFIALYLLATFLIVPYVAPIFGREKIREAKGLEAHSIFYSLANRTYVTPELHQSLQEITAEYQRIYPDIKIVYLDANFPFIEGFPLLPHISHDDGKKVDISFIYKNESGASTNLKPSVSGYGVYTGPKQGEWNQARACKDKGYRLYDFPKYLSLGTIHRGLTLSENETRDLVQEIVQNARVGKLFIEPHLKKRLRLHHPKVRFHGCRAVRHDDHIHFQLK